MLDLITKTVSVCPMMPTCCRAVKMPPLQAAGGPFFVCVHLAATTTVKFFNRGNATDVHLFLRQQYAHLITLPPGPERYPVGTDLFRL